MANTASAPRSATTPQSHQLRPSAPNTQPPSSTTPRRTVNVAPSTVPDPAKQVSGPAVQPSRYAVGLRESQSQQSGINPNAQNGKKSKIKATTGSTSQLDDLSDSAGDDDFLNTPAPTKAFRSDEQLNVDEGGGDGDDGGNRLTTASRGVSTQSLEADPDALFETRITAPSPSQTYWQLLVMPSGLVVLRDWPKKRFSTRWTRDGAINPGERKIPAHEVEDHRERIISIFGEEVWERVEGLVQEHLPEP
ncbi:uncharacterized protein EV422DRAFT_525690 [Fimicolochytrium jonesii]|uniref:uncharacterized protein n=1 Tax=Fimicolochytrium jonesii TaxID=1396493 RepID=UPI0022FDBE85|nr:uncharacterized protein EV422DRAFT_525690 [Fimicolochytrium jonesii]KAI8822114.1 hypothetical protein EV422DRAFT_525690 [Fimicolochytrium jonesii]